MSASFVAVMLLSSVVALRAIQSIQDFSKHGLFWGGATFVNASVSDNGRWRFIEGSTILVPLSSSKTTLITYDIRVVGLRQVNVAPLMLQEGTMDTLQIRCILDGSPLRYSSSYISTYSVENQISATLSSSFTANLTASNHTVALQWKKIGHQVDKWAIATTGGSSGFSFVVQAQHATAHALHESKDRFIYSPGVWAPLTDVLTFFVDVTREVVLRYAVTVQPQVSSVIKDRSMELLMTRLSVDGTVLEETADAFGTTAWDPASHVMKGTVRVQLRAGFHSLQAIWKKSGTVFKSWGSSPSLLDGFAASRNLVALLEDFPTPTFYGHQRSTLHSSDQRWSPVGSASDVLTFTLTKECAVLVTYALPVSQYDHPSFDSDRWLPLSRVDSRVVVDGVAYTYAGGATLEAGTRRLDDLFGSLALVLPAGSHTINLEWRSDGFDWTTINDGGLSHGERLLTFISSENSQPQIASPTMLVGLEDSPLVVRGVSIADDDSLMTLSGGLTLDVTITVSVGYLSFPNTPLLANTLEYSHGVYESVVRIHDTLLNINSILLDFIYLPPTNWFGKDYVAILVTDNSNVGFGSGSTVSRSNTSVVIEPVDDPFILTVVPYQHVEGDGSDDAIQYLAAVSLEDIDSQQDSVFRVQLSATCGTLGLDARSSEAAVFFLGDGERDSAVDFQAPFPVVRALLQRIAYRPDVTCSYQVHQEVVVVRVVDTANAAHDVSKVIALEVTRDNLAPEIISESFPRWRLKGLGPSGGLVSEGSSTAVRYTQYPSMVTELFDDLSNSKQQLTPQTYGEASSSSELSVFTTDLGTYALAVRFDSSLSVRLEGSNNYLMKDVQRAITLTALQPLLNYSSVQCVLGEAMFVATIDFASNAVRCKIVVSSSGGAAMGTVTWLTVRVHLGDVEGTEAAALESNYVPLFITTSLLVESVHPEQVLPRGESVLTITTSSPGLVDFCVVNNRLLVDALPFKNRVTCRMPPLDDSDNATVYLQSSDGYFKSNAIHLNIIPAPMITDAFLHVNQLTDGQVTLVVTGEWQRAAVDLVHNVHCAGVGVNKIPVSKIDSNRAYCLMDDAGLPTTGNITATIMVSLYFDNQPTNSIAVRASTSSTTVQSASYESVDKFSPSSGPFVETGVVTFLGAVSEVIADGSSNSSQQVCRFGDQETVAAVVDDFTVVCAIPQDASGPLLLFGALVMEHFDSTSILIKLPVIRSAYPLLGGTTGGARVMLSGVSFSSLSVMSCMFGEMSAPALYISDASIVCISPAHAVGAVDLRILVDDIFAISSSPIKFYYGNVSSVSSISPSAGPVSGGTVVAVTASGSWLLPPDASCLCLFGDVPSAAAVAIDSPSLHCSSPPAETGRGRGLVVPFSVLCDGSSMEGWILEELFRYLEPVTLTDIYPVKGQASGGDNVIISASDIPLGSEVRCSFGGTEVVARIINRTAIECGTPRSEALGDVPVSISIDGYEVSSGGISFAFFDDLHLLSINPTFGAPAGGTEVTVLGSGFSSFGDLVCLFGASPAVPAAILSDTALVCSSPPGSIGPVNLTVLSTGRFPVEYPIDSSSVSSFIYMEPVQILGLSPSAGPTSGGAIITVSGKGLASLEWHGIDSDMVFCNFGESSNIAVVLSDTELSCIAPSVVSAQSVQFHLSVGSLRWSTTCNNCSLGFDYFDPISITDITPDNGDIRGEASVTVHGLHFVDNVELYCSFGGDADPSPALLLDSTTIECISPAHDEGIVEFGLLIGGFLVGSSPSPLTFSYTASIAIHDIAPRATIVHGGGSIVVSGQGFSIDANMLCSFGNISTPAEFTNASSLICAIPPSAAAGIVEFVVLSSIAETATQASNALSFSYLIAPSVTFMHPMGGSLDGGTVVTVEGYGFATELGSAWSCRFGNVTVAAAVHSSGSTLDCVSPPVDSEGARRFSVQTTAAAVEAISSPLYFQYVRGAILTSIAPSHLSSAGGDVLTLHGLSLLVGAHAHCSFRDGITTTPARIVTPEAAECESPVGLIGVVKVVLNMNGLELTTFDDDSYVEFVHPVLISGVDVDEGVTAGGTAVVVQGVGFSSLSVMSCIFGEMSAPALYISDASIVCISPAHAVGAVDLRILVDDIFAISSSSPIEFRFKPGLTVTSVSPSASSLSGGAEVLVEGSGFTAAVHCDIGGVSSAALLINDTHLACRSPARDAPGLVDFKVVAPGGDSSLGRVLFRYLNDVTITSIYPQRGSTRGGDAVTLSGLSFPNADRMVCLFGHKSTPAFLTSAMTVECVSPYSELPGEVAVGLQVDFYDVLFNSSVKFTYERDVYIEALDPVQGPSTGGFYVTVQVGYTAFDPTADVSCQFGAITVPAVRLSERSVACRAPRHAAGVVLFSVALNGVLTSSTPARNFTFVSGRSVVSAISPSMGSVLGGNMLLVSGSGFDSFGSSCLCRFDDQSSLAIIVSDSSAYCSIPASDAVKTAEFRLIGGASEEASDGAIYYRYVESSTILGIQPSRGGPLGGDVVLVSGTNFITGTSQVSCLFGESLAVDGRVLNSSTIQCVSPPAGAQIVSIGIRIGDYSVAAELGDIFYEFIPQITLYDIVPKTGSTLGGEVVVVSGSGFTLDTDLRCLFGDVSVSAHFESFDTISCTSPSHTSGSVELSVAMSPGGAAAVTVSQPLLYRYFQAPIANEEYPSDSPMRYWSNDPSSIQCRFNDSLEVNNDRSASCSIVEDPAAASSSRLYSTHAAVAAMTVEQQQPGLVAYPIILPVGSKSSVTVGLAAGGDFFHLLQDYHCVFGSQQQSRAMVLSSSRLVCVTPAVEAPAQMDLVVYHQQLSGPIANLSVSFSRNPVIISAAAATTGASASSSSIGKDGVLLKVEFLDAALEWTCTFNGVDYQSIRVSSSQLVCLGPWVHDYDHDSMFNVSIRGSQSPFRSNTLSLAAVRLDPVEQPVGRFSGSASCPLLPGIRSYRNNNSSALLVNCLMGWKDNSSSSEMSPWDRLTIDRSEWFRRKSSVPPRSLRAMFSFDYANVPSYPYPSMPSWGQQDSPSTGSSFATSTSCAINSNTSCFASRPPTDVESVLSADFPSLRVMGGSGDRSARGRPTPIVLHSTDPTMLDSLSDSWVTVQGRGFTNSSQCLLNNVSMLPTVFLSRSVIQCSVGGLDTHRSFMLSLSVVDSAGRTVSLNSITLMYKTSLQETSNLAADTAGQHSDHRDDASFCASSTGCEVELVQLPINRTAYGAYLDVQYFGDQNYSIASEYSNEWRIHRNELLLKNTQQYISNRTALSQSTALGPSTPPETPTVLVVAPLRFHAMSSSSSEHIVHCYGSGFTNTSRAFIRLDAEAADCFAQSSEHLVCVLSGGRRPGKYPFEVVWGEENVTMHRGSLSFVTIADGTVQSSPQSSVLTSNSFDPVATPHRRITSLRPLSGSVQGSTVITITGKHLASTVKTCTFRFDEHWQSSVPAYSTPVVDPDSIRCSTPPVATAGLAQIILDTTDDDGGLHLSTNYHFRFFHAPQVSFLLTSHDSSSSNDYVLSVYGSHFPTDQPSFCNLTFTSGYSLLAAARTVSSQELVCSGEGARKQPLHHRVLSSASISFNGEDFIFAERSFIVHRSKEDRSSSSSTSVAALYSADAVVGHSSSMAVDESSLAVQVRENMRDVNPVYHSRICDSGATLQIDTIAALPSSTYNCLLNGAVVGAAQYLNAKHVLCSLPPLAPGVYQVATLDDDDDAPSGSLPSAVVLLHCLLRPKLLAGWMKLDLDGSLGFSFSGLNLHHELSTSCRLGSQLASASVGSSYGISCRFDVAVTPHSLLELSVDIGDLNLAHYLICTPKDVSVASVALRSWSANESCSSITSELLQEDPSHQSRSVVTVKAIRSFLPRVGLTSGNTAIEIIADGITFQSHVVCIFSSSRDRDSDSNETTVDAIVVDADRVLCSSPPSGPRNSSVSLSTADGSITWCCEWFLYRPLLQLRDVSPAVVGRDGGHILVLRAQAHSLMETERLYCYFDSVDRTPAYVVDDNAVSCVSPAIPASSAVGVAVGSSDEVWSESILLSVSSSSLSYSNLNPARGSVAGNTTIQISVPAAAALNRFERPSCLFGEELLPGTTIGVLLQTTTGGHELLCGTPPARDGRQSAVDVYVTDAADDDDAWQLFVGVFTYEVPADVSNMFPSSANQGAEASLTIVGTSFHDSPLLSCVLDSYVFVPARWLSQEVLVCVVPAEATVSTSSSGLSIRVSNNQQDLSHHAMVLHVKPDNMIVGLHPLASFATGRSEVVITFRTSYGGSSLFCRFDGTKSVAAFQNDSTTFVCLSPKHAPSLSEIEVVDSSGDVLVRELFVFRPLPIITSWTPAYIVAAAAGSSSNRSYSNAVTFFGQGFTSDDLVVRFRGDLTLHAVEQAGSCGVDMSQSQLHCTQLTVDASNKVMFLDVSVDGVSFVEAVAAIPVFELSTVVSVDPLFVVEQGSYPLGFVVDQLSSGGATLCVFEVMGAASYTAASDAMMSIHGELTGVCVSPSVSVADIVTWSIAQAGHTIFGPVELAVIPRPVVKGVDPLEVYAGRVSAVVVDFLAAVYEYPRMHCLFQGQRHDLQWTTPSRGVCLLDPLLTGSSGLYLTLQDSLALHGSLIANISVVDAVADWVLDNDHVAAFTPTSVSVASTSCMLQSNLYCRAVGADASTSLLSACSIVCIVDVLPFKSRVRLDICSGTDCEVVLYSAHLKVLSAISIAAVVPSKAPALGGVQVVFLGSGFVQDPSLRCVFGRNSSSSNLVTVVSPSRALCTLPPGLPGACEVSIERAGIVVSTSIVTFEYLPSLLSIALQSDRVSSLGGTLVTIATQRLSSPGPYECRFDEKYVPAAAILSSSSNSTTVSCVSPSFDLMDAVSMALSLDGVDISEQKVVRVVAPPEVLYVDPDYFPAMSYVDLSVLFAEETVAMVDSRRAEDPVTCKVSDAQLGSSSSSSSSSSSDNILICHIPDGLLSAGQHRLSLEQLGVEFFSLPLIARSSYGIESVQPLSSFDSVPSWVTLTINQHATGDEYSKCCFGDMLTPAILVSSSEWRCNTPPVPMMLLEDTSSIHQVPVGLARSDHRFCEYFGFSFSFYRVPKAVAVSSTSGSVVGGTAVAVTFDHDIAFDSVYCRVGLLSSIGQIESNSITCITEPCSSGLFDIEIATNGMDFVRTGFQFEFLKVAPSDTAPDAEVVQPEVYLVDPSSVSSISQSTVTVRGEGFRPGAFCVLRPLEEEAPLPLASTLVSEGTLLCELPVHTPGISFLSVRNLGSRPSEELALDFVLDPSIDTTPNNNRPAIEPECGPKSANTIITVHGYNLNATGGNLYCLVGEDWSFAFEVSSTAVKCLAPGSQFSGKVPVRVADSNRDFFAGRALFEYVEDPLLFDVQPSRVAASSDVLVTGIGFLKFPNVSCLVGDVHVETAVLSNSEVICRLPRLNAGTYSVTLVTNGQHVVRSGLSFEFMEQISMHHLWPLNGPALRGGTVLSVFGIGFSDRIDMSCMVDMALVPAVVRSSTEVQCRLPPHRPGRVNVSLVSDGALLHPAHQSLQFLYAADVSIDKITPESGYTSGDFPVFIFGANFLNTTGLGCRFADMKSRGIFLSNVSVLCLAPSPIGRPDLARLDSITVEVTLNGLDYTDSGVLFSFKEPCDQGFYCPGSAKQSCPNGTYCPVNARNFTICSPGTFQPREGQTGCVTCPIGYICPDQGMSRPVNCPPGLICDSMGLRVSFKLCPNGHYCLNNTKSSNVADFKQNQALWTLDNVTGVVSFVPTSSSWAYTTWPLPAVGSSRPSNPPEFQCDGLVCAGGTQNVLAEAPFPCPIGHYCRAGVGTQIPVPKNFSTPQRCFDGFFCPRGSVSPEGQGPCPNGYFCPTQLDAIICPPGHYCPGVGNTAPVECYPGTFNPFEGKGNCTVCPTGYICPSWGILLPEPCPAGFVCMALGLSYPVVQCPAGYYCAEGTLTLDPSATTKHKPQICNPRTFCLGGVSSLINVEWISTQSYGSTKPQICSEGTYCQPGAYLLSGSGLCFQGHYCPPNTSFPVQTPLGNFASKVGSVAPTLCYPGTYAPLYSQVSCLKCPSGNTCIGYGNYIPGVCPQGTYRSQVDSVTCTACPTGTYSNEVAATDITSCLPCPRGRVCWMKQMESLNISQQCPPGYFCGYGTDRSSQFSHATPAGYHSQPETVPDQQYDSYCLPGFYCPRGTPTYSSTSGKCPVGSYCPRSTPAALNADTKCPYLTTSASQLDTLQGCTIQEINVCDKTVLLDTMPMEDVTYLNQFSLALLDGSNNTQVIDSSLSSSTPTGEVQVVKKVYPVNISSSSPFWVNDTVEAFRACPLYGSGNGGDEIIIVGRNFLDTKLNFCRFRACISANLGQHPRRCKNQITTPKGDNLRVAGVVSESSFVVRARYISPHRIACITPEFLFNRGDEEQDHDDYVFTGIYDEDNVNTVRYSCKYVDNFGSVVNEKRSGNLSYVRECDATNLACRNKPSTGYEFFNTLTLPCTAAEIYNKLCANKPELYYMMNPCMSGEAVVEVTNDGEHYSGGLDLDQINITATQRYLDGGGNIYANFKNFTYPSTFAVYTYVYPEYMYTNADIMTMERRYCDLPRYSEEGLREREMGLFKLNANEAAHVQVNLEHIPADMVYDQHYRIAIFIVPSRCTVEVCNSARVRLSPEEFVPCRKPAEFSYWFQQTNVPKNVKNNITVYALDDMVFKVEIHILYGLYVAYAPLFLNSTTVRIASPSRANTSTGGTMTVHTTRRLSPYVSFNERVVDMQYFFTAVVKQTDSNSISQPLNLPPLYKQYERGRALIMNNVSSDSAVVPLVLDPISLVNLGSAFWIQPATTADESKEQLDAYFETFHQTTYDPVNGYVFSLNELVLPYLPYFSNCFTFDSYIPLWLLFEGKECALPHVPKSEMTPRYKFPPLPDQDDIFAVGPFNIMEQAVSDYCVRFIECNYEEDLNSADNTPRWFEVPAGDSLFQLIRYPVDYFQYTGRKGTGVSQNDLGGGAYYQELAAISTDNFINVEVTQNNLPPGCGIGCFPRSIVLDIGYFQETPYAKKIVYANFVASSYDTDSTNTGYSLQLEYYALDFYNLVLNFAFPLTIFIVMFMALGFVTVVLGFIGWAVCRVCTTLQNPPQLKLFSMLGLVIPPAVVGVYLGIVGIWFMTSLGNYLVNGYFITSPVSPLTNPPGTQYLDQYPIAYGEMPATGLPIVSPSDQANCRLGRIGAVFFIVGFLCFVAGAKMYFPKPETKREHELAEKRTELASRELWNPIMWRQANFIFTSFIMANIVTLMIEYSFSETYSLNFYVSLVMFQVIGEVIAVMLENQLTDAILVAPVMCAYNFGTQVVTFGSPDFLQFLLSYLYGVSLSMFQRVFQHVYLMSIYNVGKFFVDGFISLLRRIIPAYLIARLSQASATDSNKDFRKRQVEGVPDSSDDADSVEPILAYFCDCCSDTMMMFYFPFMVYLFMQYRVQLVIPSAYNIRQSDMVIYLVFQVVMLFFQPFFDVFNHSQCEQFHGWKIYEYLVYSRYRFLQRETRWKGMENSLDECIDESLRKLDQMCFSSQYYLMLTVQFNGIVYIALANECFLNAGSIPYSPFSDPGFPIVFMVLVLAFYALQWLVMWAAVELKVWKIKHENTAWHLQQRQEDELDLPAWEEIKGASSDAYLMNQRITSETFRYKFLNYNRTWLINQLPQLLTPRTMRRSRPYLINQLARIINARRDDISDDDEKDKDRFGPVALTAPSRNIIRWWLGKARRRLRLRAIVEPLIKRARGAQCEMCLSRKQLQIEYDIDVDKMGDMYDNIYPDDEEVDQVQWKQFWVNNQRYHTICLACLTRRKELQARDKIKGAADASVFDDGQEDYPEWGPVFLSAASKAMLLNWYRKAQRLRAGKRGNKRKEKVMKTISDDEGEDLPKDWLRDMPAFSGATKAIAVKWMRTARARLQKKHGKGTGLRDADLLERERDRDSQLDENFKSGKKSKMLRK